MVPSDQSGENLVTALINPKLVEKEEEKIKNKALEVIEFLNLKHLANELAGNLSGGQKKLLELGRTMMVDSKLVLLDEVGAGVNRTLLKDRNLGFMFLLFSKTSRPAPANLLALSILVNAFSSIISPLAVLIIKAFL